MIIIAHSTQVIGKQSEMKAALALISNGWQVADPMIDEVYDLVGRDPVNGQFATFQVKTIRKRSDRNNEMVITGKKSNGETYQPPEVDYMLGIDGDDVWMTECTGLSEYWVTQASASKRWVKLTANNESEAV